MSQSPAQHKKPAVRLPPEMWDYTLDFLHADKKSLKTCTLVCRMWLNTARLHLFQTLYMSPRDGPLSGLTSSLSHSRHIVGYVRLVTLRWYKKLTLRSLASLLRVLAERLPKLGLILSDTRIVSSEISSPVLRFLRLRYQSSRFPVIGTLAIGQFNFSDSDANRDVFPLLNLFARINFLGLKYGVSRNYFLEDAPVMDTTMAISSEIQSFQATELPIALLMHTVQYSAQTLRSLNLQTCLFTWDDVRVVGSILPLCPNLVQLYIQLLPLREASVSVEIEGAKVSLFYVVPLTYLLVESAAWENWNDFGLSRCERLQELVLRLVTDSRTVEHFGTSRVFKAYISMLRFCPLSIRCILLQFLPITGEYALDPAYAVPTKLRNLEWKALDNVLCEKFTNAVVGVDFLNIASVQPVLLDGGPATAGLPLEQWPQRIFDRLLPMFRLQGRLAITYRPDESVSSSSADDMVYGSPYILSGIVFVVVVSEVVLVSS